MPKSFSALGALVFCFASIVGCGADSGVTVSPVDDSVVHTEEEMKAMEESNASDMMSK